MSNHIDYIYMLTSLAKMPKLNAIYTDMLYLSNVL